MDPFTLMAFQLATATPFLIIQTRVIYVLIRQHKQFNQPFFKLILLNNIAYMTLWILIHVGQHNFPLYQKLFVDFVIPDTFVHWKGIVRYLTNCCAFTTFLCCFFLSLNRLTSIVWPVQHHQLWIRVLPLVYTICIVVPLLSFWGQFFTEARHELNKNDVINFYYFEIRNGFSSWSRDRFLVVLFELAIVLLCFSTNVISTIIIYCSGRISNLREIGAFSANFIAICMFDLTVHLFWLFFDLASYLYEFHGYSNFFFWVQIVYLFVDNFDFIALGTFLILTNHSIRKAAFSDLFFNNQVRPQISDVILFTDTISSAKTKFPSIKKCLGTLNINK